MTRQRYSSGSPWEAEVGYSRAVRVGQRIIVSGTTGIGPDGSVVSSDAGEQARQALRLITEALEALGGQRKHVVRTRMYVTDITQWREIGRVHEEFFGAARPATTMVEVRALIDPAMLIEIEAEAIIPTGEGA